LFAIDIRGVAQRLAQSVYPPSRGTWSRAPARRAADY